VTSDGRLFELPAPAPEFRLAFVLLAAEAYQRTATGPEIALCLGDRCRLADADSSLELRRGQSAFISPGPLRAEGEGRLYLASVP
jgi:mannose-6-phosphate isomerase class I